MRDGDNHLVVGIEIFGIELFGRVYDFGLALVAIFLFDFDKFVFHYLHADGIVGQYLMIIGNHLFDVGILVSQLVLIEAGQLTDAHIHNGLRLLFAEREVLHQARAGLFASLRSSHDFDYLFDVVRCDDKSFEYVCPLLGFGQVESGPAQHHFVTVVNEGLEQLFQVQGLRTTVYQCDVVDTERRLQVGHFEQFVQYHTGVGIFLDFDNDAHAGTVGLVVDVRDTFQTFLFDQVGNFLNQFRLVDGIGNFRYDNRFATRRTVYLDFGFGTDDDTAATGFESIFYTGIAVDDTPCGEVGSLDILHQLFDGDVAVVDQSDRSIDTLRQVVRRHVGSHTYGNTRSPVYQQLRYAGGQYGRFFERVIEVRGEIDRILLNIAKRLFGNARKSSFGITHGGRAVAVDRTEVTLAVDQGVTQ